MKKNVVLIAFYDKVSMSLRLLSSLLKKNGHNVTLIYFKDDRTVILDKFKKDAKFYQFINNGKYIGCGEDVNPPTSKEYALLASKVREISPDVIGISTRTPTKDLSVKVVRVLRQCLPNAMYVTGGYGPTTEPEDFLDDFDFVCLGEGEAFAESLSADFESLPNIIYRQGNSIKRNPLTNPIKLDELPYADWTSDNKFLIEDEKITPLSETYDRKTYDIFASRGCPSTCSYCMANQWRKFYRTYGFNSYPKVRIRSPQSVIAELVFAKQEYNISYVRFMDSIFGYRKRWLFEFLDLYDTHIGLDFFCNLDVRFVDRDIVKRLSESPLRSSTVGIQCIDEQIRRRVINRRISNDQIIQYAWLLHDHGIRFQYDILHWNPFDTEETLSRGVPFLRSLPRNHNVAIFELKFFPGSRISNLHKQRKASFLPSNTYEYWAWIYVMTLKNEKFDPIVDFILKYKTFKKQPAILRDIYEEVTNNFKETNLIVSRRTISKGEPITTVMLDTTEGESSTGISYDNRFKLINLVACRNIAKDQILTWEDFYASYGYK